MWADHHVLKVRALLLATPGVQDVIASSTFRMVALSYDPAVVGAGAIMGTLDDAGYSARHRWHGRHCRECPGCRW